MIRVNPPLKWHGGKWYLAPRIVALMPPHVHYVEPYAGGLSVLLAKDPEGVSEVVSDLEAGLVNFWRVLRDEVLFDGLHRLALATPFSESLWRDAHDLMGKDGMTEEYLSRDPARWAWLFFVHCRQSMAGRRKCFGPVTRRRTRQGMNEQCAAWLSCVDGLPEVHARLRRVLILGRPALDVIDSEDAEGTLFYLDPPYLHETRAGHTPSDYAFEMSNLGHAHLLARVGSARGKVMISGYPSEMYDDMLAGWTRHTFDLPNHASHAVEKRRMTECLWCNF